MTISSVRVIPELLYYAEQFVLNSSANKSKIPFTGSLSSLYLSNNSFIRLLFDENWDTNLTTYRYLYRLEEDQSSIPENIKRRMMVYPTSSKYYVSDSDSTAICNVNIFNLHNDDLLMLDLLLQYRLDSTSVTSIELSEIDYENLSTNLSKLIYNYLNFKINNDYSMFDNTTLLSYSGSVLENFYEAFISDLIFKYISNLDT